MVFTLDYLQKKTRNTIEIVAFFVRNVFMGGGFRQSAQVLYFGVRIRFNKYFPHQCSPSCILYAN